jgi:acyl-CoA synthetase (AMP-forming)/AMP-acid ligase II
MWLPAEIITVDDIPRYWAKRTPQATALIDGLGRTTYAELDRASDRVASAILAAGLRPPANVGFLGKNSSHYFELLFGVIKAGCAMGPLNWRLAVPELVAIVEDAECPLIFVDREYAETLHAIAERCRHSFRTVVFDSISAQPNDLDAWIANAEESGRLPRVHPRDTAVLIYTSGTTSKAKGVELTHRAFDGMRLAEHLSGAFEWRDGDVMLTVMPVFHLVETGLSLQALYNGAAVSVLPAFDPAAVLRLIARDRPSICALVPTAIQMLIDHPDAQVTDFSSLRSMMYAGSPISSALLRRALARIGCGFMQFYGASESLGPLTLLRPEEHDPDDEAKLRSCGSPVPLVEIRVVDPEGNNLPTGEIGELWVRGPTIFRSYWKQPEATAAVLMNGWYRTGDAGYRDASGFFYLVDRVKDMIVSGGENVYSAEVEQAVAQHPAVESCAVIGIPDPKWGESVTAVIVPRPGARVTAEDILRHCRTLIAGYKVPKAVHFTEALPLTTTGKILKRAVREEYSRAGDLR